MRNGRCILGALLAGWVVLIFGTSAIIAAAEGARPLPALPGAVWAVADEVGPFAKLSLMAASGALWLTASPFPPRGPVRHLVQAVLGAAAAGLVLALLPEAWSRGFGIGLTGDRFDRDLLPIYLGGGAAAGLVFEAVFMRCGRGAPDRRPRRRR